jgi:hypothetical protein
VEVCLRQQDTMRRRSFSKIFPRKGGFDPWIVKGF